MPSALQLDSIQIRDPFVLPIDGTYLMIGTTDPDCWNPPGVGFNLYRSVDLRGWDGPICAFRRPQRFWADRNFWAPEIHRYDDRFYLFASFKSPSRARGTQIFAATAPEGPFRRWSVGPVTPASWESLDGTLHVEADLRPWIIFCHEWVQIGDGTVCAMPLTRDLRAPAGEPVTLFDAREASWTGPVPLPGTTDEHFVTDGPFLWRTTGDALVMIWSSFTDGNYAVGQARSVSGKVTGPWEHAPEPLFAEDGGHAMVFRGPDGLYLALHAPNVTPNERARFVPIGERDGWLVRDESRETIGA